MFSFFQVAGRGVESFCLSMVSRVRYWVSVLCSLRVFRVSN